MKHPAIRLISLEPQFLEMVGQGFTREVDNIQDAQGIRFFCPKCFWEAGSRPGVHGIICWSRSRGIPDDVSPGPGRWLLVGTDMTDLTLNGDGGSRSVLLTGGCRWHGFITNGIVTETD